MSIGSPVVVALDSYPDKQFNAALVKVYPAADRQKGTVKIEVQIARPDLQIIKPEMSAKVSFLENQPAATQQPRITVPKGAVRIEEGKTYAWTVRKGIVQRVGIVPESGSKHEPGFGRPISIALATGSEQVKSVGGVGASVSFSALR